MVRQVNAPKLETSDLVLCRGSKGIDEGAPLYIALYHRHGTEILVHGDLSLGRGETVWTVWY